MALGMNTDKSQPQLTLAKIQNAADRERYQPYEGQGGLIQLQCGACHQLDSGDFGIKRDQLTRRTRRRRPPRAPPAPPCCRSSTRTSAAPVIR